MVTFPMLLPEELLVLTSDPHFSMTQTISLLKLR
jgi:hypothetical protein